MNQEKLFFIPAGGIGSRLKPLTLDKPKPMLAVEPEKRIIDYSLNAGINNSCIVTCHFLGNQIKKYINKKNIGIKVVQESKLFNVGGSVVLNQEHIKKLDPEFVCIIPGDHYLSQNTMTYLVDQLHQDKDTDVLVLGTNDLTNHNTFTINSDNYWQKQETDGKLIASLGIYVFRTRWILDRIKEMKAVKGQYYDLMTDIVFSDSKLKSLSTTKFINLTTIPDASWRDLGTIEDLYSHIMQINKKDQEGNVIFSNVEISKDATVTNSIIFPNSSISAGCHLENSIIDESTHVAQGQNHVTNNSINIYSKNIL